MFLQLYFFNTIFFFKYISYSIYIERNRDLNSQYDFWFCPEANFCPLYSSPEEKPSISPMVTGAKERMGGEGRGGGGTEGEEKGRRMKKEEREKEGEKRREE